MALGIGGLSPRTGFPPIVRGGTDAVLPPDLVEETARTGFFQNSFTLGTKVWSSPDFVDTFRA
jgi:hypothetical protein